MTKTHSIGGRLAASVCALALGLGGTSLLFGDVMFGAAEFTQKHFQTICIVIATTTAWMAMTSAFKKRHIMAGFGFLILALAGSGVIGWNSLGRQTEGQMLSTDDHDKAVDKRGELTRKKAAAEETIAQRQKEADAECKTGEGSKCRGARAVVKFWAENAAGIQAQLDVLKVKPADASAEALGNLTNAIGGNGTKAKALSMLLMPIFLTVLFEYGFTMALHYVFKPSRKPTVDTRWQPTASETNQTSFPLVATDIPDPTPPKGPRKRVTRPLPANVIPIRSQHPVVKALEQAGRPVSNRELSQLMGVSEGEASKSWQEVSELLEVGRQGRERRIALR